MYRFVDFGVAFKAVSKLPFANSEHRKLNGKELKRICKNACLPYGIYHRFRKVQLIEVDHRVAHKRNRFTGELATTKMFYR